MHQEMELLPHGGGGFFSGEDDPEFFLSGHLHGVNYCIYINVCNYTV